MKHRRSINRSGEKEALSLLEWALALGWVGLALFLLIFSCLTAL